MTLTRTAYDGVPYTRGGGVERATVGALLKSAVEGDQDAWRGLVDGLSPLVWSVVRGHRLSEADAHEVYQIAWFRFAQNLGRIREPEKAGSWLAATARHECLKVLRAQRRWTPTDDPQVLDRPCDSCSPEQKVLESEEEAERADRHRTVWEEFDALGDRCRQLLRLIIAEPPPSYREVSVALGIAVGSIGPIRQRCLRRLRKRLTDRGVL